MNGLVVILDRKRYVCEVVDEGEEDAKCSDVVSDARLKYI